MDKPLSKADLARRYRDEHGSEMPTAKLARIMYEENKLLFPSYNAARSSLRYIEGKSGSLNRPIVKESKYFIKEDRPKNPYNLPESYEDVRQPYKLPLSCNNVLMISDLHIPYHNIDAITIALDYGKKNKVNTIFINGDLIDNAQISKFERDFSKRSVKQEFDATKQFLVSLRKAFPSASIFWAKGNHCYIDGTEVLTDKGFVNFKDLIDGDLIAEFDEERNIRYSKPISLMSKVYMGDVYDIDSGFSRQVVTGGHHVIVGGEKIEAKNLIERDLKNIPCTGNVNNKDYDISDEMLRVLVNTVCDGCIVLDKKYGENKMRVQFKISKERKIEHLCSILESAGIKYSNKVCVMSGINILQPYYIRIYGREAKNIYSLLGGKKRFPSFFRKLSKRQAEIVIDEISITDGHIKDGSIFWTTTSKFDIDVITEMCALNGLFTSMYNNNGKRSMFGNAKKQYFIKLRYDRSTNTPKKISRYNYNGIVHCAEMPLGNLITRYGGRIAFSGNCVRWEKFLMQKVQEIWDDPYFRLEERLSLNEQKITMIDDKSLVKIGKLTVAHGHHIFKGIFSPVSPARGAFMKAKQSIIVGHLHRASHNAEITADGEVISCWSTACLCELKPSYSPQVSNHQHGFAHIVVEKNGDYSVRNFQIIKGKIH